MSVSKRSSYCIIGAGTAGVAAARRVLEVGGTVTIFEQTDQIGGTWIYTDTVGKDRHGLDVHSSMYQGLRTNLPKEVMGFPDFPIADQPESYVAADKILDFIRQYADRFGVTEHIRFEHHVTTVVPVLENQAATRWHVEVIDLPKQVSQSYIFDFVFVCNGHYHTPNVPSIVGRNLFQGRQLHSHDYRSTDPFTGEAVLVIGAGPSGMDLALEIAKRAHRVTISHHMEPLTFPFPSNLSQRPDVLALTEFGARFVDGQEEHYSVILYCTGFRYSFPFLTDACAITVENNHVQPLYKHCINIHHPTMAFIGLPYYVCAAQMMDLQVRFCLQYFTGVQALPTAHDMLNDMTQDMQQRRCKGYKKHQAHMMGTEQETYYADLAQTAAIEPIKPVMAKLHNESSQRFIDDLINFRNDVFRIVDDENFVKL